MKKTSDNQQGHESLGGVSHILFVEGQKIEAVKPYDIDLTNKVTGLELYMKRGNKFYFKNAFGKQMLELDPPPKDLIEMKYGEKVNIIWSYERK